MMEVQQPASLRREFRHRAEVELQRRLHLHHQEERERKERRERHENDADDLVNVAATALTEAEVALFTAELDTYDEATVIALQENEAALAVVRDRLDELLSQAHVLPDGRRVFMTEDGRQVFDEHGLELDTSVIDPDAISARRPTWEMYQPLLEEEARLRDQQIELLDYQADLDEARERLDAGDITREEFDELRGELRDAMPDAVRLHVDDMDVPPGPDERMDAEAEAPDLEITADMIPTGMTPPRM